MSKFVEELESVGIVLDEAVNFDTNALATTINYQSGLVFSGYADFTPITVTSGTRIKDANMERDKL